MKELFGTLTPNEQKLFAQAIAKGFAAQEAEQSKGDGKAVFIEEMTDSEYAKWEHEQEHGWKRVYDALLKRDK